MNNNIFENIRQWGRDRNLHESSPFKQLAKLVEEQGELAEGLSKNNQELIIDSIGDMVVVLTNMAMALGYEIEDCIEASYIEIKDRKGKTVDGIFIKESDLNTGTFIKESDLKMNELVDDVITLHLKQLNFLNTEIRNLVETRIKETEIDKNYELNKEIKKLEYLKKTHKEILVKLAELEELLEVKKPDNPFSDETIKTLEKRKAGFGFNSLNKGDSY